MYARHNLFVVGVVALCAWAAPSMAPAAPPVAAKKASACVECHSDTALRVSNKKLFDYFQDWKISVHAAAGVSCHQCHGGDAHGKTKKAAHDGRAGEAKTAMSSINFRNVPATCASCHKDVMSGYKESEHYRLLMSKGEHEAAPNCVTCHGSVSVAVMGVSDVRAVCSSCHTATDANQNEIPDQAARMLSRIKLVDTYTRFVSRRGSAEDLKALHVGVEPARRNIARTWHTFDLAAIDQQTEALLQTMHGLRDRAKLHRR